MPDNTQSVSGTVVPANGTEQQVLAERAQKVEAEIIEVQNKGRSLLWLLAQRVYHFKEERMWESLGAETLDEWLASPEVEISEGYFHKLARAYRELVVQNEVPLKALQGVDVEKMQVALPAIRSGDVKWQDAVADAKTLTRKDMTEEYSRGRNKPLDAEDEPEKCTCPTCGTWVRKDKIEEAA